MNEKLKQRMDSEILKLTPEKREAINSIDWVKITEDIGKNFSLTEVEIHNFQTETGLVLIGLVDPTTYTQNIEDNVGTTKVEAEKISSEAFNKIFSPLLDFIELAIKNKIKYQKQTWQQSVNFIISGGDYSFFVEQPGKIGELITPSKGNMNNKLRI